MDLTSFAPKYQDWCFLRVEEAAASGFREIEWIGDEYARAVLGFGAGLHGVSLREFFAALLRRRLATNYPLAGLSSANDIAPPVDWELPGSISELESWVGSLIEDGVP